MQKPYKRFAEQLHSFIYEEKISYKKINRLKVPKWLNIHVKILA